MSKIAKYNQPKVCPLAGRASFATHVNECPHGENYVKECKEFSSWFWHKVAQFEIEPITEEKVPAEVVHKIYGRGYNDAEELLGSKGELLIDALEEVVDLIGLNKEKFFSKLDELWRQKVEQGNLSRQNLFRVLIKKYAKKE